MEVAGIRAAIDVLAVALLVANKAAPVLVRVVHALVHVTVKHPPEDDPQPTQPQEKPRKREAFRDGANGIRTRDLLRAKQALSQLSYGPDLVASLEAGRGAGRGSLVEVEVLRRALLEPQAVVVGRVLQELRRLLEHVVALDLLELVLGRVAA